MLGDPPDASKFSDLGDWILRGSERRLTPVKDYAIWNNPDNRDLLHKKTPGSKETMSSILTS